MELIFVFIIGMLIFADYRLYKTFFTPFSVIASIYLALIFLTNLAAVHLDFFKVNDQSILFIMYFLILIYLVSVIFYFLFRKNEFTPRENAHEYIIYNIIAHKKTILTVFMIGLAAKYISLVQSLALYGFGHIKGKAFGVFAHIGDFGFVLTPFLLIMYFHEKKVRYLVLILMMYMNLVLFGGKYEIMIAILHLVILYAQLYDINIRKTLKVGLITVLIGITIFVMIYAVLPSIKNKGLSLELFLFSLQHFLYYLISPIIATNYYFAHTGAGSPEILFTVPINILKAVTSSGNYVNPINELFIPIHKFYETNVGGLFAETMFQSNLVMATIYITGFFIIVYYFFNIARYRGKMESLGALLLAVVTMMFFSNFLTVSGIILPILFLFGAELILSKDIY